WMVWRIVLRHDFTTKEQDRQRRNCIACAVPEQVAFFTHSTLFPGLGILCAKYPESHRHIQRQYVLSARLQGHSGRRNSSWPPDAGDLEVSICLAGHARRALWHRDVCPVRQPGVRRMVRTLGQSGREKEAKSRPKWSKRLLNKYCRIACGGSDCYSAVLQT